MTLLITPELREAVWKIFQRFRKHGCVTPWSHEPTEEQRIEECEASQLDTCSVLVDHGVTVEDVVHAYGALMAMECIRFKRWPSNHEILAAINSRRPDASTTAVQAEATAIFVAIVDEVQSGRHRDLEARVAYSYGLAAAEALAAIGGGTAINSAGPDYLGAKAHTFQEAYVAAVAGGRDRGDAKKALPAPKPLQIAGATVAAPYDGPTRIAGSLEDLLRTNLDQTLGPRSTLRVVPPVDPEARLAQLRRQAQELLSQEAK